MSENIKRMLRERASIARAPLIDAATKRKAEVKAAFEEGHRAGMDMRDPDEAWQDSQACRALYPGPPAPFHRQTNMRAASVALDGVEPQPERRNTR